MAGCCTSIVVLTRHLGCLAVVVDGVGGSGGSLSWNDKFVVKPVLTRQAVLKLLLMDEAPSRQEAKRARTSYLTEPYRALTARRRSCASSLPSCRAGGRARDQVVAEAGVPLVSLLDQRPHLFWLPMVAPEQTGWVRRTSCPCSRRCAVTNTMTP